MSATGRSLRVWLATTLVLALLAPAARADDLRWGQRAYDEEQPRYAAEVERFEREQERLIQAMTLAGGLPHGRT